MSVQTHVSCLCLFCLLITTAAAVASSLSHPPVPGVGFSLTPDYGTAAIFFQNGSHVEVARIEGSPAYKSFMRKGDNATSIVEDLPGMSLLRNAVCPPLQPFGLAICERDPDFDSCQGLLRSLQSSVASYLGTTFCYAGVVVPDQTWQYQDYIINKAIKSVGLRLTHRVLSAAKLVMWANRINNPSTPRYETQAVLSVDYSDSGLNVNLFADDEGVADVLRQVYDQQLGADRREQPGHLQAVKALLTEVTKLPLGYDLYGHQMPDKIQRVVLYGDAVMDGGFLDMLKAVVGVDVVDNAQSFAPVFTAAIGMATSAFERENWLDFNVEPAFGCRWRSRLYDAPSEEL
ncbi:hypothetical protein CGLO_03669 [Colletotrichum gloeosporioides Cg-14]|uniref:Uncharacterized protein n=1 Tax=Colletotrichum gloeosporioides (strain Cg-14) TaxID=1237896 RepID=T0KL10_COLGC|nr:hypothetical protein CGLO_03669 [Colletotrichum gloeosporioides Cg-14]